MQVNSEKNCVKITNTLFNCAHEQGFESDIILPDYCPDIARILKCNCTVKVSRSYFSPPNVETDGTVFVTVYYLCNEGKIHAFSTKIPFSKSLPVQNAPSDQIFVKITPKIQYVNCRAVNSRRLDIRGAAELSFAASYTTEKTALCESEDNNICLRKSTVSNCFVCDKVCRTIPVTDEFTTQEQITNVLRTDATATISECKVIANKIIIKAQMQLNVVKQNDSLETSVISHQIPISQIIDISGMNEQSVYTVDLDVTSLEVTHRLNQDTTVVNVQGKVNVCVTARNTNEVTLCDDAYSTTGEVECECETIPVTKLCEHIDTKLIHRHRLNTPENSVGIVDLWYQQNPLTYNECDGEFCIDVPLTVMYIYKTTDGTCEYAGEDITITHKTHTGQEFDGSAIVCECVLNINEVSFSVNLSGDVLCKENKTAILSINHTPKENVTPPCALTIYYSKKGEKVWDIAKRYRTKTESICLENGIDGGEVDGRILIIPTA